MCFVNKMDNSIKNEQEMRCYLRERFLKATSNLNGKQCCYNLHGGTVMNGIFRGADIEFNNVLAENLKDPTRIVNNAILRATDIIFIKFDSIE